MQPWQKIFIKTIQLLLICCSTLGFFLCISAFAITNADTPEYILLPLTTVLLTLSSFLDSFLLAKSYKENGIKTGLIIGCIFTLIVVFLSVYYRSFSITNILLTKIAAIMLAGIIGGIIGVNF